MAGLAQAAQEVDKRLAGQDVDVKISSLHALDQELQAIITRSSEETIHPVLEVVIASLKVALKTANTRVSSAGLLCTATFFELLYTHPQLQTNASLVKTAVLSLVPAPGLISYLGDAKEAARDLAAKALLWAGKSAGGAEQKEQQQQGQSDNALAVLDQLIKDQGFGSKNSRTKEQILLYLTNLRSAYPSLPLRPWVPFLVGCLEDSDSTVREAARESLVTIFTAPSVGSAAKTDLKKELFKKGVRKPMTDNILKRVLGNIAQADIAHSSNGGRRSRGSSLEAGVADSSKDMDRSPSRIVPQQIQNGNTLIHSLSTVSPSGSASTPTIANVKLKKGERLLKAPKEMSNEAILADIDAKAAAAAAEAPEFESNVVEIVYIASLRDLEVEFASMQPSFEGKETEHNWQAREKNIFKIRGMLKGDVHINFRTELVAGLKGSQEGIMKALNTLRTTLAAATCHLIIELAQSLQHHLDPLYDTFFSNLLKMSSLTKRSIAQLSQDTAAVLIRQCSYHSKTLPLLASYVDVKNIQMRTYTIGHLRLFVATHGRIHKGTIESSGGLETLDKALRRSLADANAAVREVARATFWLVNDIWPLHAKSILESLDFSSRKLLEQAFPGSSHSKSLSASTGSAASRPSVRSLISSRRAVAEASAAIKPLVVAQPTPIISSPTASRRIPSTPSPPNIRKLGTSHANPSGSRPSSVLGNNRLSPSSSASSSPISNTTSPPTPHSGRHSSTAERKRSLSGESTSSRHVATLGSSPLKAKEPSAVNDVRTSPLVVMPSRSQKIPVRSYPPPIQQPVPLASLPPSPILLAMAQADDQSTFDEYTLNIADTVPLPHETSSDEESINLLQFSTPNRTTPRSEPLRQRTPQATTHRNGLPSKVSNEDDISRNGTALEADEELQQRAEQAELTAHRFLEVIEPNLGSDSDMYSHPPENNSLQTDGHSPPLVNKPSIIDTNPHYAATPFLKRIQDLHLNDSPDIRRGVQMKASIVEDSWWLTKANMLVSRAVPLEPSPNLTAVLRSLVEMLKYGNISSGNLVKLARFSLDNTYEENATPSIWQYNKLFGNMFDGCCAFIQRELEDDRTEPSLILLKNLIINQNGLLGGRELEVFKLLLELRGRMNKGTAAASEVIIQLFIRRLEPLYALLGIRTGLEAYLKKLSNPDKLTEGTALAYGMALKTCGVILECLPSEVLEEELQRLRPFIKEGLNNQDYPHLRQAAVSAIVDAHTVLQNDIRLFDILGGLTKSQIHLCTYLFARENSQKGRGSA